MAQIGTKLSLIYHVVYRKYDFPYTTDAQTVDQVPTLAQRPTLIYFLLVMISKITEPCYL